MIYYIKEWLRFTDLSENEFKLDYYDFSKNYQEKFNIPPYLIVQNNIFSKFVYQNNLRIFEILREKQ